MLLVPNCNVLFFAISDKAQSLFLLLVGAELVYCFILVISEVTNPTHNAKLALILHFIQNYFYNLLPLKTNTVPKREGELEKHHVHFSSREKRALRQRFHRNKSYPLIKHTNLITKIFQDKSFSFPWFLLR